MRGGERKMPTLLFSPPPMTRETKLSPGSGGGRGEKGERHAHFSFLGSDRSPGAGGGGEEGGMEAGSPASPSLGPGGGSLSDWAPPMGSWDVDDLLVGGAGPSSTTGAGGPPAVAGGGAGGREDGRLEAGAIHVSGDGGRVSSETIERDGWVTVFGFNPSQTSMVLREFQQVGDVVKFGTFGPSAANWVHLKYRRPLDAQRALSWNGRQVSPTLVVGVVKTADDQIAAIEEGGAGNARMLKAPPLRQERERVLSKPYLGVTANRVPQPAVGFFSKLTHYVFGN